MESQHRGDNAIGDPHGETTREIADEPTIGEVGFVRLPQSKSRSGSAARDSFVSNQNRPYRCRSGRAL